MVLRHHKDKLAKVPGYFMLNEYWRLDDPSMRAVVNLDLANNSNLVAFFSQAPKISMARRLLDLFRIGAGTVPDVLLTLDELDSGAKTIPYADKVPQIYKNFALALHRDVRPIFFIDPAQSHDDMITMSALVEKDLNEIIDSEGPDLMTLSYDKRLARVGAQQILGASDVTLNNPTTGSDMLSLMARRRIWRDYQSQPQQLRFDQFLKSHQSLIRTHVALCQSSRALQMPLLPH